MKVIGHHFGLSHSMLSRIVNTEPGSRFKGAFVLVTAGFQVTDQHLDPGRPYAMISAHGFSRRVQQWWLPGWIRLPSGRIDAGMLRADAMHSTRGRLRPCKHWKRS